MGDNAPGAQTERRGALRSVSVWPLPAKGEEAQSFRGELALSLGASASSIPSSWAASALKARTGLRSRRFVFVHLTALPYQRWASSFSPSCQWAIDKKNMSKSSLPQRSDRLVAKESMVAR